MPDLAEFLLARIAEDEADIGHEASPADYCDAVEGIHLSARRALAECEAKRRIVEGWRRLDAEDYGEFVVGGGWDPGIDYASDALEHAMRALALPYADHPDYREEWRP